VTTNVSGAAAIPATRRATSTDVAREAGVSRATVSFVLNETPHQKISAETRNRVREAASRLQYAPSAAARTLRKGRSDIVLCLLPHAPLGAQFGGFLGELSARLALDGFTLLAHPRPNDDERTTQLWQRVSPAAVIAFDDFTPEEEAINRALGIDVTAVVMSAEAGSTSGAGFSNRQIGRLQARHLWSTGHRHLGYAFPDEGRYAVYAGPRLNGVEKFCVEKGLTPPVRHTMALTVASAVDALRQWAAAVPPVTAICAYNDNFALALLAGIRHLGLTGPSCPAVVGVDDIPAAAFAQPPLTTVAVDSAADARHVAESVLRRLEGRRPRRRAMKPTIALVRRESA
jgi:DNA-binding LacI/PurR family transcriptional regulator